MSEEVKETQIVDAPEQDVLTEESTTQIESDVATDDASSTQVASGEVDNNIKSMSGKIQSLEKERNSLQEKTQTLEEQMRILEAIDRRAAADPEFRASANRALLEEGVISQEQYNQIVGTQAQQGQQSNQPVLDKNTLDVIEYAKRKKLEDEKAEEAFFEKFENDKPEFSEGTEEDVRGYRQAIGMAAATNMRRFGNMSREEAFNLAYKQILRPDLLKEEGEVEALAQAQTTNVSIGSGAGGSATASPAAKLTQDEVDIAEAMGMTPEEYAAAKEL